MWLRQAPRLWPTRVICQAFESEPEDLPNVVWKGPKTIKDSGCHLDLIDHG